MSDRNNRIESILTAAEESATLADVCGSQFTIEQLPSIWSIEAHTNWLVEGLIPEAGVTLITGDSGVGKSTLALAMLGAVAHGQLFLARQTVHKRTLYVDGENPAGVVRERLERLQIAETSTLHFWGGWCDPQPGSAQSIAVIDWAKKHQGLIVYDSLIAFHPGSEQDSSETRRYMAHYRALANTGASVVVLHHTGKGDNSKQYRGSSDIKASVDQALCLEAIGDAEGSSRALRLTPFKCRIAEVQPVRLDFTGGVFQLPDQRTKTNRESLEEIIQRYPNSTGRELASLGADAGIAKNRVETLLIQGTQDGWLIVTPGERNSKHYRLAEPDA